MPAFKEACFEVHPEPGDERTDIIQAIKFKEKQKMVAFCQGLQMGSPVDSHVVPVPGEMPGYTMSNHAGGTFIQGNQSFQLMDRCVSLMRLIYRKLFLIYMSKAPMLEQLFS